MFPSHDSVPFTRQHEAITTLAKQQQHLSSLLLDDLTDHLLFDHDQYGLIPTQPWAEVCCTGRHNGVVDTPSMVMCSPALQRIRMLKLDLHDIDVADNDDPTDGKTAVANREYLTPLGPPADVAIDTRSATGNTKVSEQSHWTGLRHCTFWKAASTSHSVTSCAKCSTSAA